MTEKRKPGRPSKSEAGPSTRNLTFRTRDDLRDRLSKAAAAAGRSVSEEIEFQLNRNLTADDTVDRMLGGSETALNLRVMAFIVQMIEQRTGKRFSEDAFTCEAVKFALHQSVDAQFIAGTPQEPLEASDDLKVAAVEFGRVVLGSFIKGLGEYAKGNQARS